MSVVVRERVRGTLQTLNEELILRLGYGSYTLWIRKRKRKSWLRTLASCEALEYTVAPRSCGDLLLNRRGNSTEPLLNHVNCRAAERIAILFRTRFDGRWKLL